MRTTSLLLVALISACASTSANQKPFDQMTADEHRAAAAREHRLANESFAKVRDDGIAPPETVPGNDYVYAYDEFGGAIPSDYDPFFYDLNSPESYVAWPRVTDSSERDEDAASEHRENALRHERAAAALEGRPSPQPLPPVET